MFVEPWARLSVPYDEPIPGDRHSLSAEMGPLPFIVGGNIRDCVDQLLMQLLAPDKQGLLHMSVVPHLQACLRLYLA